MYIFRLFAVSIFIPLISVGLCATGDSTSNFKGKLNRVKVTDVDPRRLEGANSTTINFPSVAGNATNTTDTLLEPRKSHTEFSSRLGDSLPVHPHPLKLEIKSISNSTRVDEFDPLEAFFEGEGRDGGHGGLAFDHVDWIFGFIWKAVSSYVVVAVLNLLLAPLLKKFGWGPSWETSVSWGEKGDDHGGWERTPAQHPGVGGHPGGVGHLGAGAQQGWLSYDQYALALPYVDKYSQKAAKKSAKYAKKAQRFAEKASKYAAKSQAYRLQVKPQFATSYINPGAGSIQPGIPGYGWGR